MEVSDLLQKQQFTFSDLLNVYDTLQEKGERDLWLDRKIVDLSERDFEKCWQAYKIRRYLGRSCLTDQLIPFIEMLKEKLDPLLFASIIYRNKSTLVAFGLFSYIQFAHDALDVLDLDRFAWHDRELYYAYNHHLMMILDNKFIWRKRLSDSHLNGMNIELMPLHLYDVLPWHLDLLGNFSDRRFIPVLGEIVQFYLRERGFLELTYEQRSNLYAVIMSLGITGCRDVTPILLSLLKDQIRNVRREAIRATRNIMDERLVEPLIEMLRHTDDDDEYQLIAETLGRRGDIRAWPVLKELGMKSGLSNSADAAISVAMKRIKSLNHWHFKQDRNME